MKKLFNQMAVNTNSYSSSQQQTNSKSFLTNNRQEDLFSKGEFEVLWGKEYALMPFLPFFPLQDLAKVTIPKSQANSNNNQFANSKQSIFYTV